MDILNGILSLNVDHSQVTLRKKESQVLQNCTQSLISGYIFRRLTEKKDSQKILNATLRLNSVCFQTYKENGLSNVSKLCYEAKISPFFLDIPIKKWFLRYLKIDFEDNSRHFQISYV